MLLVTVAVLFLACLPPEAVSQQCRSGFTDEIRQSVREQLRQGQNGTISTVAVNCGQVRLVAMCSCMDAVVDHTKLQTTVNLCLSNECSALQNMLEYAALQSIWLMLFFTYWMMLIWSAMHQNSNADDILVLGNMSLSVALQKIVVALSFKTLRCLTSVFVPAYLST